MGTARPRRLSPPRRRTPRTRPAAAAGLVAGLIIGASALVAQAPPPAPPPTFAVLADEVDGGIAKRTFDAGTALVYVWLPGSIVPGAPHSGTVFVAGKGATEADRAQNRARAEGTKVAIHGTVFTIDRDTPRAVVEFAAPAGPAAGFLPVPLTLTDPSGQASAGLPLPVPIALAATPDAAPAASGDGAFRIPPVAQQGHPTVIACARPGCLDGRATTTRLTIGGESVPVAAESPNLAVFMDPESLLGEHTLAIGDGAAAASSPIRSIGVDLSLLDGSTELKKGEKRTLQVRTVGLSSVKDPFLLRLGSTGVINMEGGDLQIVLVRPGDADANGAWAFTRTLRGKETGRFGIEADVVRYHATLGAEKGERTLQVNLDTGDYVFCDGKDRRTSGTAPMARAGAAVTLSHDRADWRIGGRLDPAAQRGSATATIVASRKTMEVKETAFADAKVGCWPVK